MYVITITEKKPCPSITAKGRQPERMRPRLISRKGRKQIRNWSFLDPKYRAAQKSTTFIISQIREAPP